MLSCSAAITATEFIDHRVGGRSRFELLGDFLSEMLNVRPENLNIFSLSEPRARMLDVRVAMQGAPSLRPEKLHGYLAAHKQKVNTSGTIVLLLLNSKTVLFSMKP